MGLPHLSKKYFKIPQEIADKLEEIIGDSEEFDMIKCEIQRSPEKIIISEFFSLYDKLMDELDENSQEDTSPN